MKAFDCAAPLCREQAKKAGENKMHGVHLRAPIRLRSADDLQYAFSNYVHGYVGLLDYIWYDPERLEAQVCSQCLHSSCVRLMMLCECKGMRSIHSLGSRNLPSKVEAFLMECGSLSYNMPKVICITAF